MGITMVIPVLPVIHTHCSAEEIFQFRSVSPPEVELILKSLDSIKATGYDKIPPRPLRDGADALAHPLSVLTNKIIDLLCVGCLEADRNLSHLQKGRSP